LSGGRSTWLAAAALAAFVATGAQTGAADGESAGFTLAVTGNTQGNLEVCGCPVSPAGGLTRRAFILGRYRDAGRNLLPVEAGGFWVGRDPIDNERILTYLRGLEMMDWGPVLLGEPEFSHPREDLEFILSQVNLPFIASNVGTATGASPLWRDQWEGEIGGVKVGVLGLTRGATPEMMAASGFTVRDPATALAELLPPLRDRVDVAIVLSDLGPKEGAELVASSPGIDILVNIGLDLLYRKLDDTLVAYAAYEGRLLRLVGVAPRGPGEKPSFSVREKLLDEETPEDPDVRNFLDGWYAEVAARPEYAWHGPIPAPGADTAGTAYVGAQTCGPCHKRDAAVWGKQPHAMAMLPLHRQQRYFIPRCYACHVTGPGEEGGFASGNPRDPMRGVQCEACHGPGSLHAADPDVAPPIPVPTRETCAVCHDAENSPRFSEDFEQYWENARHSF